MGLTLSNLIAGGWSLAPSSLTRSTGLGLASMSRRSGFQPDVPDPHSIDRARSEVDGG
jgi:hypothetical protein